MLYKKKDDDASNSSRITLKGYLVTNYVVTNYPKFLRLIVFQIHKEICKMNNP